MGLADGDRTGVEERGEARTESSHGEAWQHPRDMQQVPGKRAHVGEGHQRVAFLRPDDLEASAADLAQLARGQWRIESVHWLRDTVYAEDANTGYAGNGPQAMATLRNLAISLLYLSGVTQITRTLQAITRDQNRILDYLPL